MFSDNTLTPKEAIRLCALGTLALEPLRYSELATAIRHFVSRIQGPNLEMMGSSIELLKFEGLIEAVDGVGMEDDAVMRVTPKGDEELKLLLTANIRATATELNKLVIALKFRFLHLLKPDEQKVQLDLLIDVTTNEHARLDDLRQNHGDAASHLNAWLDHDIQALSERIQWLKDFRAGLENGDAGTRTTSVAG